MKTGTKLSDQITQIGHDLVDDLERQSPLYRAMLEGRSSIEGYAEFLLQHHKYIRHAVSILGRYAEAMTKSSVAEYRKVIGASATRHCDEERGHDEGMLRDLAALWHCSRDEALARVDATETAPAVTLFLAIMESTLEKFPCATVSFPTVIEVLGMRFCRASRDAFLANRPFPEIDQATQFLFDHMEDGDHVAGGALRIDCLKGDHDRAAALTCARLTAVVYRDLWRYLDQKLAGRVEAAPALVGAGA